MDPFEIDVSLRGATAEVHDRQTRVPGSFARLWENLPELLGLGLRLQLRVPLTRWNEHQAEAMCALADGVGVPIQFDTQITPRDSGDLEPLSVAPSAEGVARLFELLQQRAESARRAESGQTSLSAGAGQSVAEGAPPKHCGAGSTSGLIDPVGNVYRCVQWRRPLGNLHTESIGEIWGRSPVLADVRQIALDVTRFMRGQGEEATRLSFCPGLAEQTVGSALRLYPSAERDLAILRRLDAERSAPPGAKPVEDEAGKPPQRPESVA